MDTGSAIRNTLRSVNVLDSNMEPANVVDVIDRLATNVGQVATGIWPDVIPGNDEAGGCVGSLSEAVMGITAGLCKVAEAIELLAMEVRTTPAHHPLVALCECEEFTMEPDGTCEVCGLPVDGSRVVDRAAVTLSVDEIGAMLENANREPAAVDAGEHPNQETARA
jgi:hypothetical protein